MPWLSSFDTVAHAILDVTGQMTKRGMVHSGRIARTTIGLLSAAMLILFAPVAAATPDSDADAAISAAWDAGGGATGPLGSEDGGVYPVGEGFGQNFAGG